jgi:hypothetical protein
MNEENSWGGIAEIPEEEAGKFEVNFSGKVKIDAFDSGDAIRDVVEKLREEGFLVESVSAYKQ